MFAGFSVSARCGSDLRFGPRDRHDDSDPDQRQSADGDPDRRRAEKISGDRQSDDEDDPPDQHHVEPVHGRFPPVGLSSNGSAMALQITNDECEDERVNDQRLDQG